MTSDRPYRVAPGQSFAVRELGHHAGTQFDPRVVEALTSVLARAGALAGAPVGARSAA
jgi:HD-GYP domain-containing protein (c-di-GMP phosphodiesterase class II)